MICIYIYIIYVTLMFTYNFNLKILSPGAMIKLERLG